MRDSPSRSSSGEAKPLNVRIFDLYILTFNGFFDSESDILKPRWLPTALQARIDGVSFVRSTRFTTPLQAP